MSRLKMTRSATGKVFMLLIQLAAIMIFMSAGVATEANAITLAASEPQTIYYTTNGAAPAAPMSEASTASAPLPIETVSLVPDAGKGKNYVKYKKQKIHDSKHEFEKHVKQKHGKRFKVETYRIKQTDMDLKGTSILSKIENPKFYS